MNKLSLKSSSIKMLTQPLFLPYLVMIITTLIVSIQAHYGWSPYGMYNPWMVTGMNPMMAASYGSYSMVPPPMGFNPMMGMPTMGGSSRMARRMGGIPMSMPMGYPPMGPMGMPPMGPMMGMYPGMRAPGMRPRPRMPMRPPTSTRELTGYKLDGSENSGKDEAFADQIVSASMRISNGGSPVIRYRGPRGSKFTIGKPWEFFS